MSNSIPKNRLVAFKRQAGSCYYCGFPMWIQQPKEFAGTFRISQGSSARFQCTAEHLVARQDGGSDSSKNIVAACRFCNSTRHRIPSAPDPTTYKKRVQRRVNAGKWHPRHLRNLIEPQLDAIYTETNSASP